MPCTPRPGDQLRELRNRLGVTTREVEELSRKLAERTGNQEYYISNEWLTQLENKDSVPSIYKLFSLSVIYRSTFADLWPSSESIWQAAPDTNWTFPSRIHIGSLLRRLTLRPL